MFDTHAHLSDKKFNHDREEVVIRAKESKISKILTICSEIEEMDAFHQLLDKYDFIYGAVGIHPHNANNFEKDFQILSESLKKNKIVAFGEIGLDYFYEYSPKEVQKKAFRKQLQIAKEKDLPVIIHSREAMQDSLKILEEEKISLGVLHCFSGTKEQMHKCIAMGLYISIAGPVTFPKAIELKKIAKIVPLDKLLIETDCPYLAPQIVRGKRNEPSYLKHIIAEIAAIRDIRAEELIKTTTKNGLSLFKI